MPANKKYLTHSKWQRFAKISAALLGGLSISICFFTSLAFLLQDHITVISIAVIGLFPLWILLIIVPFLAQNGWKIWLYYLITIILLIFLILYGKNHFPIR